MSNYSKATNFSAKDSLPSGNAAKIVKGTELDAEFSAIETAIATKADASSYAALASPALTGTPTAPTAAVTTDNTQIATTAFVWDVVQLAPAFSAYASAATLCNNAVTTKVGFQTEEFDTAGCFASSRFTPNVAGYYWVQSNVRFASAGSMFLYVYKNGSQYKEIGTTATGVNQNVSGGCLVYMNGTTDYLEIYVTQGAASQNTSTGSASTWFQGYLARPA
jgi:hypothetical protein